MQNYDGKAFANISNEKLDIDTDEEKERLKTYNEENNYYYFTIESKDTENLKTGTCVFNIKVISGNKVKTICAGKFIITDEVAYMESVV